MTRLLLTNDDGIEAPGLAALEAAVQGFDVQVFAPRHGHSGCGHQVTTHRPLVVEEHAANRCSVDGTPADTARLGLTVLYPNIDWVLSGINAGGNLGADSFISGTIAAVREAAMLGKPGIAFSHYRKRGMDFHWEQVSAWAAVIIRDLLAKPCPPGCYFNVNFPHLDADAAMPEVVECFTDTNPLPVSYRYEDGAYHYDGSYHLRPRAIGSDIDVCFAGKIAVAIMGGR